MPTEERLVRYAERGWNLGVFALGLVLGGAAAAFATLAIFPPLGVLAVLVALAGMCLGLITAVMSAIGLFSQEERLRAVGGVAVSLLAAAIPPTLVILTVWALATAWRDGGG